MRASAAQLDISVLTHLQSRRVLIKSSFAVTTTTVQSIKT